MRFIAITIMKMMLMKAKNNRLGKDPLVQKAYDNMINSYENTIMYLKVDQFDDIAALVHQSNKIRCQKFEVLEIVEKN